MTVSAAPTNRSAIAQGGAGFDPREPAERRLLYFPIWSTLMVPARAPQEIRFFQNGAGNRRVSNIDSNGQVNAYKSFLVRKILLIPAIGTGFAAMADFWQNTRFEIEVMDKRAYEILTINTPPGVGGFPFSGVPFYGEVAPAKSAGIGQFTMAGGVSFALILKFAQRLRNINPFPLTCIFQAMGDVPA